MMRTVLFVAMSVALTGPAGVHAQSSPKPLPSPRPVPASPASRADPLQRLVGDWAVHFGILGGGEFSTGNSFAKIGRPDPSSISFSFRSRYDLALKTVKRAASTYSLTIKSEFALSFDNLPLTYTVKDGFSGNMPLAVGGKAGTVGAWIKFGADGGHDWCVFWAGVDPEGRATAAPSLCTYSLKFSQEKK